MEVKKLPRRVALASAFIATGAAGLAAVPAASAHQVGLRVGPAGITHIGMPGVGSRGAAGATLPSGMVYSTNWAGYAESGSSGAYSSVTTSWVQQPVNCSVTPNSYAAFWAGLDGYSSSTVEQDGTLAECVNSRHRQVAQYLAWYEAYPAPMYQYGGTVAPYDTLTSTVTSTGSGGFTLLLTDTANGATKWQASKSVTVSGAALSSAEVIAEAPSSYSGVLPLADFGTVNFTGSAINNTALSSAQNPIEIEMVTPSLTPEAIPSALSGANFSVVWKSA